MPNVSPLFKDYINNYDKVAEFYNGSFRDFSAFQNLTEQINSRSLQREKLADILIQQNRSFGCSTPTIDNIRKLTQSDTFAVVTGQQVGLFSGPLYTMYKSLTAIKLAETLNQNCDGNYVPVFWLASDDHDLDEINHINLLDKNNQITKLTYPSQSAQAKVPASDLEFTSKIIDCLQSLDNLTQDSEFKSGILSQLATAYQPGRTFAESFGLWMTQLFKSSGLILIDASHVDLKALGKQVFYQEVEENSPSTEHVLETSKKLIQAGYHTQIELRKGILNLFFTENQRQTVQSQGDDFFIKDSQTAYTRDKLLKLVEKNPVLFSPNVLLRPIYQDFLLPTVAYVGGPGEISYYAQIKSTYTAFGIPMPIIYPRKSITLLKQSAKRIMTKHDLQVQDIWQDADGIINRISKQQIPKAIDQAVQNASSHIEQDFDAIKREIINFEPTLEKSVDLYKGRIDHQYQVLQKKILQAYKKRNSIATQQLHKTIHHLYPNSLLQERVFNVTPFLIKYGQGFLDKLYQALDINNFDHQVIEL